MTNQFIAILSKRVFKKLKQPLFLLAFMLLILQIAKAQDNQAGLYQQAIQTAMYPAGNSPDTSLVAISKNNPKLEWKRICDQDYVLVVTWKSGKFYPDSGIYNTGAWSPIWITTAPELKERMKKELTAKSDTAMRLKQLLGLPPNATYNYFYEMWVHPDDLFRPCPDKEINDRSCSICFSHKDSSDVDHINWINATRLSRYYACGLFNQYPWTELGYTYDWNPQNKTHIGLSEFVIRQRSRVYIKKVYSTQEYLRK
ncbi:MAG: hypothetical protein IT236_10370 [Bacteroidia bacterium]|nr:hypothetical protein [Bacteroidia bacterium]